MGEFAGLSGLRKDCRRTSYDGCAGGRDGDAEIGPVVTGDALNEKWDKAGP